jgi:SAM-dependent methyltransferase
MTPDLRAHWNTVYLTKPAETVSWYQAQPGLSLDLISAAILHPDDAIIDVGAGASTLADALLRRGTAHLTLLDLSEQALAVTRARLGEDGQIEYRTADILKVDLPQGRYALWHDRAVFHFLTEEADQARYVQQAHRALRPGGTLVLGTFALDGPQKCSGLEARQYSPEGLSAVFAPAFRLLESRAEQHLTPGGQVQRFTFVVMRRLP